MEDKQITELAARAAGGDKQALTQLCEEKARQILYVCTKLCGNQQYGQDAAQDVLLYMQTGIRRLRKPESFSIWLNRIINSSCMKVLRREKREAGAINLEELVAVEGLADESTEFLPVEWAEQADRRARVLACIQKLTPKQQQVLLMFYFEEMSLKEIAGVLRTTPETVNNALFRARGALKKQLKSELEAQPAQGGAAYAGLPVLTLIFQKDASELVSPENLRSVLATAGVAGGVILGAVPLSGVAGGLAVSVITVAIGLSGLFYGGSSSPPSAAQAQGLSPSSAVSSSYNAPQPKGEDEPDAVMESSISSLPSAASPTPGSEEHTEDPPPAQSSVEVRGRVAFQDAQGVGVIHEELSLAGLRVAAYRGGEWVATAYTDAAGVYTLALPDTDADYTLRFEAGLTQLRFVGGANAGLAAGGSPPLVYVTDIAAPVCGVRMLDAHGDEHALINPASIEVLVADATPCAVVWAVEEEGSGTVVAQGSGGVAAVSALPATSARYLITFTVTDLAGNQSVIQRVFHVL